MNCFTQQACVHPAICATSRGILLVLLGAGFVDGTLAAESPVLTNALYSGPIGRMRSGRSSVFEDPVFYGFVMEELRPPVEGDSSGVDFRGNDQEWQQIEIDESGAFIGDRLWGGYIYLEYESPNDDIVVLQPNGNSEIFINGVPRAGDVYGKGWTILPTRLKQGLNQIWFRSGRGRNKGLTISKPPQPVYLTDIDPTLPDLLTTEIGEKWAAIRVVNASERTLSGLKINSNVAGFSKTTRFDGTVPPLTTRKIPFKLQDPANSAGEQAVQVSLFENDELVDEIDIIIEVKEPTRNYRRTFISDIDGSLQYYGVRQGKAEPGRKPALFLSVHGAGVKGIGQAGSYKSKDWGHVIAPTNRREYGFDWEDWGRLDAMEVLADAEERYGTDPLRTYLTGHSMGGHGTWYLGATYPSRWAAIAPMAGWRSFFSYVRTPAFEESRLAAMLNRAANPSRTLELSRNYLHHGVFIEHGDNDQSVPVEEARFMREHLASFHPDFAYHEEQGGAHWYGVDHQRAFDFFKRHELKDIRDLDVLEFRIASPGISSNCRYITLYQQEDPYEFCGVTAKQTIRSRRQRRFDEDISERNFDITTENLSLFKIDLAHCDGFDSLALEVDGDAIEDLPWPEQGVLWLKKEGGKWRLTDEPNDPREKNPRRYGAFKDAFRHHMVFVYSTLGNEDENTWSYNKARFDAETFYYRGNGAMEVIPDDQFTLEDYADRSVILYGNATTNGAWSKLLEDSPVQVRRGELSVGDRVLKADDLGIYMIRPRKDSEIASVGVVAGTGMQGFRTVVPNRYFLAGTGYPDLMILTPDAYKLGVEGVLVAGYFGNDWSIENGSIVWQED